MTDLASCLPRLLNAAYSVAAFAALCALVNRGERRFPWLLLLCSATSFWEAVCSPWAPRDVATMYCSLLALRAAAAAEAVWRLDGVCRRWLLGTAGLSLGWLTWSWHLRGDALERLIRARDLVQLATFTVLLVPLVVVALTDRPTTQASRHGSTLLTLLGAHAAASCVDLRLGTLPWAWWLAVDAATVSVCIGCCLAWINPRTSREGAR